MQQSDARDLQQGWSLLRRGDKEGNMKRSKQQKREDAQKLLKERAKRTDQQQLARLDTMFGEGKGAQKERARLLKKIGR